MIQEIYIIDDTNNSIEKLKKVFKEEKDFRFKTVKTSNLELALKSIPSLIIINEDNVNEEVVKICEKIRADEDNSITPIIVCSSNKNKKHKIEVLQKAVEYYMETPVDEQYLFYTIKNIVRLMYTNRRVSPLTGLPGNVQIQAELKKRLLNNEKFEVLYLDLDNFKAYNDTYGFLKGDEIIKFTAKTISKHVHSGESTNCFVGHIGGDDFVAIVDGNENYEEICQNIIIEFDTKVLDYFNETDRKRGYVEVPNRKNIIEQFPLTSISVGVVVVYSGRFKNTLEIGEIGAQVKHLAKITPGSAYVIDKRKE
ncbi:MAG: diguanylate cyclase [Clostridia bacterium]|nr:diguanylate cyclase [Clostridia bacterium]